jgi:hypothetical protein
VSVHVNLAALGHPHSPGTANIMNSPNPRNACVDHPVHVPGRCGFNTRMYPINNTHIIHWVATVAMADTVHTMSSCRYTIPNVHVETSVHLRLQIQSRTRK